VGWRVADAARAAIRGGQYPARWCNCMAPGYAHVHVEGDWGIRLGKGNITIEVWDSYVASARGRTMSEQVVRSYMVPRA
jgi:hypothetical protein